MRVLVLGAGTIGTTIAAMLAQSGDYWVTLADSNPECLKRISRDDIERRVVDVGQAEALREALAGQGAVVSALPFFLNTRLAEAARESGAGWRPASSASSPGAWSGASSGSAPSVSGSGRCRATRPTRSNTI